MKKEAEDLLWAPTWDEAGEEGLHVADWVIKTTNEAQTITDHRERDHQTIKKPSSQQAKINT